MKETVKKTLKCIGLAIAIVVITITTAIVTHNKIYGDCGMTDYNYMIYRDRTELALDGCRDRIVTEIDRYIDSVATDSGLNGIKLFELCDKYDVDVRFAMAQAEAESHFGTKGIAARTNMVWNVGAFDNKSAEEIINDRNKRTSAQHPDMSIEPYLILLTTRYLVDGKNEFDMFESFVDCNGKRYASNENYESLVHGIYERIDKETNLNDLLKEYRKHQRKLMYGV